MVSIRFIGLRISTRKSGGGRRQQALPDSGRLIDKILCHV